MPRIQAKYEPSPMLKALITPTDGPPPKLSTYHKRGREAELGAEVMIRNKGRDTGTNAAAALVDENKPLTEKQLIFVRAWASGESIKTASARAGYNDGATFAYRMTKMPNVLKAFHAEKVKYEAAGQMTRKRVMDGLLEAVEMAKLMSEPATMVSGWREVGKMCGYYEPVKHTLDINVSGDVTVRQLNGMSDADLLRLIKGTATSLPPLTAMLEDDGDDIQDV